MKDELHGISFMFSHLSREPSIWITINKFLAGIFLTDFVVLVGEKKLYTLCFLERIYDHDISSRKLFNAQFSSVLR